MVTANLNNSAAHMWEELKSNHLAKYGAITVATAISFVMLKKWIAGGVCYSSVRLDGRTVIITGANTGIGKETAFDMAKRGARVVMACRDLTKAENAAAEIQRSTGNVNVVVRHLDLASLYSVRQFAHEFIATEGRLDILINNAGVMMCPHSFTEDGFETQFAVNHLGHFLLTVLLLDVLKISAPSRVINLSSIAHKGGQINFDDLNFHQKPYNALDSYRQSKLANVLFTKELSQRTKSRGVTAYAVHPGVIRTELGRYVQSRHPVISALLFFPSLILMKTPKEGAQTSIYCAVTEGLENYSGCYFSDCHLKDPAPEANDDVAAMRLWDVSSKMVDFKEED
ncbi:retinol-DH_like_SDR_c domain-containing protein isoform X2 [Brachyhypopomus gauderio]|uniref:retinol-DH_like_SDR_c domain-containing protein isoform X2 n=1 Tax=Brachyhypopomus gauderio TaxID=698409 RepID=UPI0040430C57